jgi:DNA integrity scanning protein DisA with diadenylate cyclase activity
MTDIRDAVGHITDDVDAVAVFSPSTTEYERYTDVDGDVDVLVVAKENAVDAGNFIELPVDFEDIRDGIRFGVEGGLEQGLLDDGDTIACVVSTFAADPDAVVRLRVSESIRTGIYDLFVNSRAEADVIRDVLELVIELGQKGQKGEPVGALFVVGDAGNVMNKSRPLSYNPFEKSHVHVGDPIVNVMLKEFSRLDGAFVISDAGKIVSAYRYLEGSAEGIDIPKGLGTRHMAAAAITRDTNSVSIVLSESDGLVRAFKGGELVLELDPEAY